MIFILGWTDWDEIHKYYTDPYDPDTDDDGVIDSKDMDPLVDLKINVRIKRIKALDPVDFLSPADFIVKVYINGKKAGSYKGPTDKDDR